PRHHGVDVIVLVRAGCLGRRRGSRFRRRWRWRRLGDRRRLGLGFRLGGGLVVVGDDPPDGGENLLHRGLLRLRRLRHPPLSSRIPAVAPPQPRISRGAMQYARIRRSMARGRSNASKVLWTGCALATTG